ncbi:sperm-associated antigen 16 protein-like [Corythoichthys intestinalis]|uniref:sperm-associated antigen 16 protein-like n=1 Tax=Corythoichthys intestinalis TaxID=161448 RepID=UPI0025A5F559|nr:sperm-associated antigen 16 protein-like [Corythoichthys intestinalis]
MKPKKKSISRPTMSTDDNKEPDEVLDEDNDGEDDNNDADREADGENVDNGNEENIEGDDTTDVEDDRDAGEDKDNGDDHKEEENDGSDDDYADDASLTEEEDLEVTVKTTKGHSSSGCDITTIASDQHVTADDFTRNFLSQMKMTATLDCFQTEWTEMVQKGLLNPKRVLEVPDVYVQNLRLHGELKNALREREEYQMAASTSADTLARAQKARDTMWMKRKRACQERNRLVEEARRLKAQCHSYEPAIRRMDDKFQALAEQTMRVALGRDKLVNLVQSQPSPPNAQGDMAQKTNRSVTSSFRLCCSKSMNS